MSSHPGICGHTFYSLDASEFVRADTDESGERWESDRETGSDTGQMRTEEHSALERRQFLNCQTDHTQEEGNKKIMITSIIF